MNVNPSTLPEPASSAPAALKQETEARYASGEQRRFPAYARLESLNAHLSDLDTRYRRQWDARHSGTWARGS